tara:strand:+ start:605 stop:2449 length:1845 start_codon:yes stop_codon:yes gene_type:complete
LSTNDISREVNEPAEENEISNHHHLHGVDAFQRLPNVHLTRPRAQYGIKNGFVPDLAGMPSTAAQAGMMMMMMPPPPPPLNLKQEAEDEKGQNSERSGFDSFQEEPCEDREDMEQSKRTNNDNNNSNNAKKRSRPAVGENIKRPETPFMNSPSAAADVLMSLCGDGDGGGLFAAPAANFKPVNANATSRQQKSRRNSNAETTCTGQIFPLNLKCPRRKRTSLCKNMRRSSSGSSLEDIGGESGAVVLHGISTTTATTTGNNGENTAPSTNTATIPRVNNNKATTEEQQNQRKHQRNSSGITNGKNKRQKVHRPWSLVEVKALVAGVKRCGRGQWADIKSLSDEKISGALLQRSAVDLKDKWRNVMRTALSPVLYKKREATEIPENMLEDIRSLATAKEKETLATNNAMEAKLTNTTHTAAITSPSTSGDGNDSNSNEDGEDDAFVTDNNAESSQQKNTALVERNTVTVSKSDVKQQQHAPYVQGQRRSKHHSPWTLEESQALVDGVRTCGGCRWTAIKKRDEADAIEKKTLKKLGRRTAMDLKDKWRNLLQLANLPTQSRRKRETPMSLLADVLELEKKFGDTRRRGRRTVATNNNTKKSSSQEQSVATIVPTN